MENTSRSSTFSCSDREKRWRGERGNYTLIKKNFLLNREIQMGSGAKSYMRKGFLIYKIFSPYMRRSLVIFDVAPDPSEFPNI